MRTYPVITPIEYGTTSNDQRRYEPGTTIDLKDADAKPLLACGAIGEAIAQDTGPGGDEGKASFGLTVAQLKEALEARGIEFPANANKAVLADLLDATPSV